MKNYRSLFLTSVFIAFGFFSSKSQILQPVKWKFDAVKSDENTYTLKFIATIEHGWFVYSQFLKDGGPIPTSFQFNNNKDIQFIGKIEETGDKIKEGNEPLFDNMYLKKFGDRAVFTQKVKILKPTTLSGFLEFMTCDDKQCLAPETIDFSFNLGSSKATMDSSKINEVNPQSKEELDPFENPVTWKVKGSKLSNNEYQIEYSAEIKNGWHIYSQYINEGGPIPTSFTFTDLQFIDKLEKASENSSKTHEGIDPTWDMNIKHFSNDARFVQKLKVKKNEGTLKGVIEYMACTDERCLPPEQVEFNLDLSNGSITLVSNLASDSLTQTACYGKFGCPPQTCSESEHIEGQSYLWIFVAGMIAGFGALFTPCVFPMIPLTVSFFTKGSGTRSKGIMNALLYAFFIILIYALLSLPFVLFKSISSDVYNSIATSPMLNVFFFILFVVFAISFFGYFDISLPSSFTNKIDSLSGVGNIFGIFFMALTLALVSFTCTGPFIGSLLGLTNDPSLGNYAILFGFSGFGTAFALPFALFALFPRLLHSLPKSGGWLHTVKVTLGFIELIFALKFLSNADLVSQWGLLKREVFLGIWAILGVLLSLYLFGIIRFKDDHKLTKIPPARLGFGILSLIFALYSAYGVPGNNLALFSGFPPPNSYSLFHKEEQKNTFEPIINDYKKAIELAKKENKPIMIDFTGWACVNCRKMEENVWTLDSVQERLINSYVVLSLYVDDRAPLKPEEQYVSKISGKTMKTIGNKWSDFEKENIKQNAQPYYVLISPDEKILTEPKGYTPDPSEYIAFLDCGISAFNSLNKSTK